MDSKEKEFLEYYKVQSELSDPGKFVYLYDDLPDDIPSIVKIVQNIIIHFFWTTTDKTYGISLKDIEVTGRDPNKEHNQRKIEEKLSTFVSIKNTSLTEPRDPIDRVVGNCRDFALLLTSILRHKGIPARERSGVARYFYPPPKDFHEDHFITEYWNEQENRWVMVDPQIDEIQRNVLKLTMDTYDIPNDQFLGAGKSWIILREGKIKPEQIGVGQYTGESYTRYKLIQDLASLNKIEVMAWEHWGICSSKDELTDKEYELLDKLAKDIANSRDPETFFKLKELFENDSRFKVPDNYKHNTATFKY
jgi:hypothetical protein